MKLEIMLSLAAALVLAGCRHNPSGLDVNPPAPPRGLSTSTGDNFIELFWDQNHESDLAGYNVYVATSFQGPFMPIGSSRDTYYIDRQAKNGVRYYYTVTAYDYDGNESTPSSEVVSDIPRPEGYDVLLNNFHQFPDIAGYDFSDYVIVPYDDQYADIYYEYYNGEYYMVVRTDTDIQDMGPTGSLLEVGVAPAGGWSPTHDVVLRVGHTYVVWTWDDHYAKFRVTALSPSRVAFDWAYQLQESTPLLKRSPGARKPAIETLLRR
jgi:hypothetical protein